MITQQQLKSEATRAHIVDSAAAEMVKKGYQSAAMNDIIKALGMSKGAVYYHFTSKLELGYAIIDDLLAQQDIDMWEKPLSHHNPVEAIKNLLKETTNSLTGDNLVCGCPINNLAYEMSPLDEGFRSRIENIYNHRRRRMTEALLRAQSNKQLSSKVNAEDTACFIIATMHGALGLAKNANSNKVYDQAVRGLIEYLSYLQE